MVRKCPECGSKKWKRDRVTGNAVCEDGHVLQDYRSELHVIDGGVNFALQRRRTTKGPRINKRKEEGRKNKEYFHGSEAEYLKLQAFQLLLRHQVHALMKLWSLPEVFEMIVRDLWIYQLSVSTLPELFNPPDSDQGGKESILYSHPASIQRAAPLYASNQNSKADNERPEYQNDSDDSCQSDCSRDESGDGSDQGIDPYLLAQLSSSESKGSDHCGTTDESDEDSRWKKKRLLRASDIVTTLIIGLWILRVPVMGVDIERLINEIKIPFIDFGHTSLIPKDMRVHMNRDVMLALSPRRSPVPSKIHDSCRTFARLLRKEFNIEIPVFNLQPLSWRIISSLGGTPIFNLLVLQLLQLLEINFHLAARETTTIHKRAPSRVKFKRQSTDLAFGASRNRSATARKAGDGDSLHINHGGMENGEKVQKSTTISYERTTMMYDELPPELSIAAAWVILMKSVYGLDGRERKIILRSDPVIGLPQIEPWLKELKDRLDNGIFQSRGTGPPKLNFTILPEDDLDDFLDKCENVLTTDHPPVPDANPFPLPFSVTRPSQANMPNTWATYHSTVSGLAYAQLPLSTFSGTPLPLMPGERIRSYDPFDQRGILPPEYNKVLQSAAEMIGWDKEDLIKAIKNLENRAKRLKSTVKRKRLRLLERLKHGRKAERKAARTALPR
ncbi:hypothetical protein L204_100331 [Cryptococcus depauperatus]|nr:hypothetical protein L204_02185 [Cryptococcus depauperatus CBS 7855]